MSRPLLNYPPPFPLRPGPELRRLSRRRPHPFWPGVPSPGHAAAPLALPGLHLPLGPFPSSCPLLPHVPGGVRTQSPALHPYLLTAVGHLGCRSDDFQGPIGAAGCRSPALAREREERRVVIGDKHVVTPTRNCGGRAAGGGRGRAPRAWGAEGAVVGGAPGTLGCALWGCK